MSHASGVAETNGQHPAAAESGVMTEPPWLAPIAEGSDAYEYYWRVASVAAWRYPQITARILAELWLRDSDARSAG